MKSILLLTILLVPSILSVKISKANSQVESTSQSEFNSTFAMASDSMMNSQSEIQLEQRLMKHQITSKQKKAMQQAAMSAQKKKMQKLKKVKFEQGSQTIVKANFVVHEGYQCSRFDYQPYVCTSLPECGWCTRTQQCLPGNFYGAVNNQCKWYYYVYDGSLWSRFPRFSPWYRTIVPAYYTYYDYGSPFRYSTYYYRPYWSRLSYYSVGHVGRVRRVYW